ncbi:nucleotidyltransferase family protein [Myxacorys almedinensis]|uniref:DNA polymerase subunit beta n=1 Tax=Myxacorys almedinensis A TaxID=2690445 RepID=A0A8J8CJG7_9CYAN|nr:nucleotidyltransferase family protein [Myxacorys almedinensis]NDJ18649.1 DNA polymerase subunit beta [Myxacorys almedinensis A]
MGIDELLADKREEILAIAAQHGAYNVRVFGSVARGEARADSDIDFLVEMGENRSSWFPVGLILDLEDLLGRKVDVATDGGLKDRIRERVLKEAVSL